MNTTDYNGIPADIFYWPSDKHGWLNDPVPEKPGIYVISGFSTTGLWLGFPCAPSILYVGMSLNLKKRWNSHEIMADFRHEFDVLRFSYMPIINADKDFLRDAEREFIRLLKPEINKQHNG